MNKNSNVLIVGDTGLVGSNLKKHLVNSGYVNILGINSKNCNLLNKKEVDNYFSIHTPEYIFLVAGKVGGIGINNNESGDMIYENLLIASHVINACHVSKVKKMLYTGSSCIYPKFCPQPIKEEYLLTGELEQTNIGYAVAKIAGLTMCDMYRKQYGCNFISVMPTNLYGPGDNFHLENSHVLPAIMRKIHDAKQRDDKFIELWGSGTPLREFLFIDDLAEALVFLMNEYDEAGIINVGVGKDISIENLAKLIKEIIGYDGPIIWDASKPDGTPKKVLDVSKINKLGWSAKTELKEGIEKTYKWFSENYENTRL